MRTVMIYEVQERGSEIFFAFIDLERYKNYEQREQKLPKLHSNHCIHYLQTSYCYWSATTISLLFIKCQKQLGASFNVC